MKTVIIAVSPSAGRADGVATAMPLTLALAMLAPAGIASAQDLPPSSADQTEPHQVEPHQAEPARAPQTFMIAAIDVSGATKLSSAEIERLVYPHLGPGRTNDDVIAAQKALQDAYAAKGYEAVDVAIPIQPSDLFSQGIVQITVNETPVGRVRFVEAKHHSVTVARAQIPSLVEGQPIDLRAFQRDIAAANRFPDRIISPKFKAGSVPGTIDVDLKVEDGVPLHASIELNNDNSPNTKSLRLSGTTRYSDLWGQGHTLSITSSFAPQDTEQSAVVSASYTAPLIGTPWSFLLYGYRSNSNVAALGGTNVLGNGYQIGARATYRLPSETTFQQISFGPDFKSFKENIFLQGAAIQPTKIRYIPIVAEYSLSGSTETSSYGLTIGTTAGVRVIKRNACFENPFGGAPPADVLTCSLGPSAVGIVADQFTGRGIDAAENFLHANFDLNYTQLIAGDIQVAVRAAGQLADASLVTNEQFSVGGMSSVRGYHLSEAVGDDGFVSSVEFRSPDLGSSLGSFVDELRVFAFADAGYARVRAPSAGQADDFRIAATGAGFRLQAFRLLTGEFVIGVPVRDGPVTARGDPRYGFSIKGEF